MKELQALLAKRKMAISIDFDHLNHHLRCYTHIINICCSHIVMSITSTLKSYLSNLKVPINLNHATHNDSDDNLESGESEVNPSHDFDEPELADLYDNEGDARLEEWSSSIKHNPIRHA
jgi:hypothetical protein